MRRVPLIKAQLSSREEDYKFKKILLKAIDESLNKLLGETAAQTIYFHLEQKQHLKLEDIPDDLKNFLFTLERIFGIGALIIEKIIMENLYSRLSLNNKDLSFKYKNKEHFNFINYITDLRSICLKQAENTPSVVPYTSIKLRNVFDVHAPLGWSAGFLEA